MTKHLTWALVGILAISGCQTYRLRTKAGAPAPSDAFYEQRRLLKAGFEPADALVRRDIEVQRALYVIELVDAPSVEVRHAGDAYSVSLNHFGHRATAAIRREDWQHLVSLSQLAFTPPNEREYQRAYRLLIKKAGYCHSWNDIESTQGGVVRRLGASICFQELQRSSLTYADAIARLAVDNLKECEPVRATANVIYALRSCAARLGPPTAEFKAIEG